MSNLQTQVIEFMKLGGQSILERPAVPGDEIVRLRAALIAEEAVEALEALYGSVPEWEMMKSLVANVINVRAPRVNLPKFADALADMDYVSEGARLAFGIDGDSVALEVHRANLEKVNGQIMKSASGKIGKPTQWQPPDIEGVLQKQSNGALPNVGLVVKVADIAKPNWKGFDR